jgi:hypothetical protein
MHGFAKSRVNQRILVASFIAGVAVSLTLTFVMWATHLGYWLPGTQPGWVLASAVIIAGGAGAQYGIALVTAGNAAFYACLSVPVIKAEVAERGPIGRAVVRGWR